MEIDSKIISGIIIGGATLLATIISTISLHFKNRELKREIKYLSTGMAVAYFFSFVKPLFDVLEVPNTYLETDGEKIPINPDSLRLELLIPKSLEIEQFKKSQARLNQFKVGSIPNGKNRPFGVRFKIEKASEETLIVVDFPSVLNAAAKYFEGSTRTIDFKPSDDFASINEKEIENFKKTLETMIASSHFKGDIKLI